jgi:hypothetical protein
MLINHDLNAAHPARLIIDDARHVSHSFMGSVALVQYCNTPADNRNVTIAAASDGKLWELWYTAVPEPDKTEAYIATALAGQQAGHMLPWVVRDLPTGTIIGSEAMGKELEDRLIGHAAGSEGTIGWFSVDMRSRAGNRAPSTVSGEDRNLHRGLA